MKKSVKVLLSVLLLFAVIASVPIAGMPETAYAVGSTYYVDSVNGNDSNSGTSTSTAWKTLNKVNSTTFQPGDRILFKAGCSWTGQLWPKGSGASGSPIVIDMYGSGSKPLINGNGISGPAPSGLAAVLLYNQQYWEINNLEITNNAAANGERRGVFIKTGGTGISGTLNHIYLKNLYVHDVKGELNRNVGGIILVTELGDGPTNYNDILVDGCTVSNITGNGITVSSTYVNQQGVSWGSGPMFKWTNVKVSNNNVSSCSGDGIIVLNSASPIMEYNIVSNTSYGGNVPYAGIWPHSSSDVVMQYNESYNNKFVAGDGQGFDVDINCSNALVQYNYSHDNEGGFLLICTAGDEQGYNTNTTVRYNISQNDKKMLFNISGPVSGAKIYNNTFCNTSTDFFTMFNYGNWGGYANNTSVWNNIFYYNGTCNYIWAGSTNNTFDYNCFYGKHDASEPSDAHKLTSDPMFVYAGSGSTGRNTVNGYKLQTGSPCIGSGKVISNNGGKDYWGNAVSATAAPNRGAFGGSGISLVDTTGYYKLVNRNSSKAAGVSGSSLDNGAAVIQWTSGGVYDQQWQFVRTGGGYYQLVNRNSGKAMGVSASSADDGAAVIQWTSGGVYDQQWQLIDLGGGYYKLVNRNSGKAAGVSGSSLDNGAAVIQWTSGGVYDQQWQLVKVQ